MRRRHPVRNCVAGAGSLRHMRSMRSRRLQTSGGTRPPAHGSPARDAGRGRRTNSTLETRRSTVASLIFCLDAGRRQGRNSFPGTQRAARADRHARRLGRRTSPQHGCLATTVPAGFSPHTPATTPIRFPYRVHTVSRSGKTSPCKSLVRNMAIPAKPGAVTSRAPRAARSSHPERLVRFDRLDPECLADRGICQVSGMGV